MGVISTRLLMLVVLCVTGILWLLVSSVFADALHVLAKSSFSSRDYGSVSLWLIAVVFIWLLTVGGVLRLVTPLAAKNFLKGLFFVGLWVFALAVIVALTDEFLGSLGYVAIAIWVVEIGVATIIVGVTCQLVLVDTWLYFVLRLAAALTWVTAAKALLLCFSPGVGIRI